MGIELGAAQELEYPLLHAFRDDVLQAFGLVVHLVPRVSEHLDEEHLEQPVMPHELERDLAALAGQLLAAIAVVLDEALGTQARDHLADAGRRDAEPLGELASRHGPLVAVQLVEGFEVILLRAGEGAAALELLDHRA